MEIKLNLEKKVRQEISKKLNEFLATTYALYLKSQNFHWNLKGKNFIALHLLFETHYEEMADAVDEIAERIQTLGGRAEASFKAFERLSKIRGADKSFSETGCIRQLLEGHEMLSRMGRPLIAEFQKIHDDVSSDLLIKRLAFHEKAAWMLRSHLENG